jgi:hypothetical protein
MHRVKSSTDGWALQNRRMELKSNKLISATEISFCSNPFKLATRTKTQNRRGQLIETERYTISFRAVNRNLLDLNNFSMLVGQTQKGLVQRLQRSKVLLLVNDSMFLAREVNVTLR